MFYAAEALPLNIGLSYSKHSGVIAAFGKEFARTSEAMQRLHRYIVDAESVRTVGDYSFDVTVSIEEADKVLGWADEFIVISRQFLAKNSGE